MAIWPPYVYVCILKILNLTSRYKFEVSPPPPFFNTIKRDQLSFMHGRQVLHQAPGKEFA